MNPLQLVNLLPLMRRTCGRPEIKVGLIDGPVVLSHPEFAGATIREIPGKLKAACTRAETAACAHGTLVAGVLCAQRGSVAPAICPACTLLVRPIFAETDGGNGRVPNASPEELAEAIVDSISAGASVINLSSALIHSSTKAESTLEEALNYAARRRVLIVAAAGNQGVVGSSVITRHPWVIPVAACDFGGRPLSESNLGGSIGRQGLSAPGKDIISLGADGKAQPFCGTSAAAPFATGAIALLWSEFPNASAVEIRLAATRCGRQPRNIVVPALLDAEAAYQTMASAHSRSKGS